jgi:hypothetical protein
MINLSHFQLHSASSIQLFFIFIFRKLKGLTKVPHFNRPQLSVKAPNSVNGLTLKREEDDLKTSVPYKCLFYGVLIPFVGFFGYYMYIPESYLDTYRACGCSVICLHYG